MISASNKPDEMGATTGSQEIVLEAWNLLEISRL
jgi:hypothetical protein